MTFVRITVLCMVLCGEDRVEQRGRAATHRQTVAECRGALEERPSCFWRNKRLETHMILLWFRAVYFSNFCNKSSLTFTPRGDDNTFTFHHIYRHDKIVIAWRNISQEVILPVTAKNKCNFRLFRNCHHDVLSISIWYIYCSFLITTNTLFWALAPY